MLSGSRLHDLHPGEVSFQITERIPVCRLDSVLGLNLSPDNLEFRVRELVTWTQRVSS